MKPIEIQNKLKESGLKIFSRFEFRRLVGASPIAAQKLLERYTQKGVFARLKGGMYALEISFPSSYLIANKLYKPSYISFETALSYYRVIPEVVYSFTSATTKTTREYGVKNMVFNYHKIMKKAFTGYKLIKLGGENILLAEKEKALADYLYYVFLHKKKLNDRLNLKGIDRKKLLVFVSLFGKPSFIRWVEHDIRKTN
ncbi:MAG: hypothetical protein FD145_241 [Candidatus Saganbacteria bacterium]|uniref:Transcriptional regulator n=1 Tax=Candidatus Saganbacteria bacterium TaxID=2575572 RepID=A0A833L283_UNCSA|nr:MAG: hypothetical protein FD145_241 [Candidatus Saganbacteria bacterium]